MLAAILETITNSWYWILSHSIRRFQKPEHKKENIFYCQFYMQQLPVEIQLDFKRMSYLRKLAATDCILLSHIFWMLF